MMSPTEHSSKQPPSSNEDGGNEEEVEEMEVDRVSSSPTDVLSGKVAGETTTKKTTTSPEAAVPDDVVSNGDVEHFGGKIVYNPDGSAYIIEDGDMSDDESSSLHIPRLEGSIVVRPGEEDEERRSGSAGGADAAEDAGYPQIANAFFISKSTAYYNALYGQAYVKLMQEKNVPETPVVHSYRVFTPRDRKAGGEQQTAQSVDAKPSPLMDFATVPVKPVLMCFICKLSFGCAQSFENHCVEGHSLELCEDEKSILDSKNSSAIIQTVGKEKKPLVSFLEPVMSKDSSSTTRKLTPPISPGAINHLLSAAAAAASLPKVPSIPPPPSSSSLSLEQHLRRSPLSASSPPPAAAEPPTTPSSSDPRRSPLESGRSSAAVSPSTQNNSPSPLSLPPPSYPQLPTNANMLQGTTIGACPDHVNGRPTGVECVQCDLILNQSRMGGMGWNVSRNSCKTLKCPKCNWHYKYQETLEIHMKEKHPENETTCIYCITGQQHPRLARGETYTCGYKPYRCEVCNYSTTTKGNLSIHMQSDKHLNNMQDLQNGGIPNPAASESPKMPATPTPAVSNSSRSMTNMSSPTPMASPSKQQQKPNWRCDVCNYETNVARNLRIHMTSEKHTHNMMSLQQQNAKTMQQLMNPGFPGMHTANLDHKQLLGSLGSLFAAVGMTPPTSSPSEQAAMADLAYNQAVLAQIMSGGQFPGGAPPLMPPTSTSPSPSSPSPDFAALFAGAAAAAAAAAANNDDSNGSDPPQDPVDMNPRHLLTCCVCRDFGCDGLDELSQHLSIDRSRTRENEVSIVIGGNYLCQLCNYKTNLKANFQLHCKTDKHLQRLSHVNHIKEGGPANEWKLRYLSSMNPVELRCNACDFLTNSPHKLQVHFSNQQHQVSSLLFSHLKKNEQRLSGGGDNLSYNCTLCPFSAPGKHILMSHVRSIKHLQMEQMHQLRKRAEGNIAQTEIGDIFQVVDDDEDIDDQADDDDYRNDRKMNVSTSSSPPPSISCPLCQENFDNQRQMENHAMSVHSVNQEGLQRLQSLINGSHWLNKTSQGGGNGNDDNGSSRSSPPEQGQSGGQNLNSLKRERDDGEEEGGESADADNSDSRSKSDLLSNSASSARRGGGGDSSSFSYSMEKYLDPNRPFKCDVCKESFTQKNILLVHYNSVSHLHRLKKTMQEQQQKEKLSGGGGDQQKQPSVSPPSQQHEKTPTKGSALEALLGNIRGERKEDDEVKPFKCNICKVAYSQGSTLDIHIRSVLHQTKASKLQELILTGQIDLSKPLIEQPDLQQLQEQHKKMISDMLSPKSINSTGSTNSHSSPNVRGSSPNRSSPQSSPLANLQALIGAKNTSSPPDPASSSGDESSSMICNLARTFPFIPGLSNLSPPENNDKKGSDKKEAPPQPSPVLKNLLQNYGLEVVKQFNDMQQQRKQDNKRAADDEAEDRDGDDKSSNHERATPNSESQSRPSSQQHMSTLSEVQEALQKAMIQAQLHHMNPMLMQMSQLQGLNPLVAMNLHPPLIPPALLKGGGGGGAGHDLTTMMAQMQQQMQQQQQSPFGLMDPKLFALFANRNNGGDSQPDFKSLSAPSNMFSMGMDHKSQMDNKMSYQGASQFGQSPPMPDPKSLLMQQQPIPSIDQSKRARTRITDDQLKILRSNFDINNSPAEDQLNRMAAQTGLPLKVIKHWFRNTLFKERQKNKDSPYNFNNPPSTKLNLEEYEKTGESKVTPLDLEAQAEYVQESGKLKKDGDHKSAAAAASSIEAALLKSEPIKIEPTESKHRHNSSSEDTNATINKVPKLNESSSDSNSLTLSRLLSSQLSHLPLPSHLLPNFPAFPSSASSSALPPSSSPLPPTSSHNLPDYLNPFGNSSSNRMSAADHSPRPHSPQQSISSGKRANRTRFTDYQIKVLQEFFENNAYPKDDDLEYLSKLLGLSPRVIVVWFQNARQKARKIYENQPPTDTASNSGSTAGEEESGRFTRTPGCNYQCKKCLLVFQRYYELIRHQKQHCYKEEDAKRSAQAQKAAANAAAQFAPGSNSSAGSGNQMLPLLHASEDSNDSLDRSIVSPPIITLPNAPDEAIASEAEKRRELEQMSKDAVNRMFSGAAGQFLNYPSNSPYGLLQQQAFQHQHQLANMQQDLGDSGDELDSDSIVSSPSSKRKLSEDGDADEDGVHRDKRLRTTILPEQLDFLCLKYQQESNPSRKMLEQIAGEVGLRKRVVQVWFQNTRARERKGLHHLQQQPQLLQPHLPPSSKPNHQQHGFGKRNGESDDEQERPGLPESPFAVSDHIASLIPNSASAFNLQNSMRKYYEDTMKRFMNDINDIGGGGGGGATGNGGGGGSSSKNQQTFSSSVVGGVVGGVGIGESSSAALDLTSNFDDSSDHLDDSDPNKSMETESVNGGGGGSANKRFRTQMSGVQVKMMKAVFEVYKTPTMTECSSLGQDIGLQKRVVQVWFQNARAKEKRAKLQLQQATGGQEPDGPPTPEDCKVCNFKYSHKYAVQDHIFTKSHLDALRIAIESGRYDPESPGYSMAQTAAVLQASSATSSGGGAGGQRTPSTESPNQSLQMLQMATAQVNNRELLDAMSSHQNPRMLMQV